MRLPARERTHLSSQAETKTSTEYLTSKGISWNCQQMKSAREKARDEGLTHEGESSSG